MALNIPQVDNFSHHLDTKKGHLRGAHSYKLPKFLSGVNIGFLLFVVLLVIYGLVVCYSAVAENSQYSFSRQLIGLALGLIISIIVFRFDTDRLAKATIPLLVISVVLILSPHLPVIGVTAMGARSWVKIGMQFQPGEFAKVTVILFCASLVSRYGGTISNLKQYCKVVGLLSIPFICILTQPDLGTGLVYLVISAVVLIAGGARWRYIIATVLVVVGAFISILLIDEILKVQTSDGTWEYKLLKNYQRNRLFVFLNQNDVDSSSEGYNLAQAMIAIGSGGAFGKGLFASSQSSLGFLPEAPTDFIFCVLSEELGFVGVIALLLLYSGLLLMTIRIAKSASSLFGMLICLGTCGMWLFQILENIGMCCGVMPITGIPLPFVSYGSSFMIVNFACVGLIMSIWRSSSATSSINKRTLKETKNVKSY